MSSQPSYYGFSSTNNTINMHPVTQVEYDRYSGYSVSDIMHIYRFSTEDENTIVCSFPKTNDIYIKSRYISNCDIFTVQAWLWYTEEDGIYRVYGTTADVEETSCFTDTHIHHTIDIECALDIIDIYNSTHALISRIVGCNDITSQLVIHPSDSIHLHHPHHPAPPHKYNQYIKNVQARVPGFTMVYMVDMDILHRASSIVSSYFKGWKARMKYRFSPYTSLGKYIIHRDFQAFTGRFTDSQQE